MRLFCCLDEQLQRSEPLLTIYNDFLRHLCCTAWLKLQDNGSHKVWEDLMIRLLFEAVFRNISDIIPKELPLVLAPCVRPLELRNLVGYTVVKQFA
jgi:hypothetical protein